jgi:hypothetical protein
MFPPRQIYAVGLSILSSSGVKTSQLLRSIVPLPTVSIKDLSVYLSSKDFSGGSLHYTSVNSLNQALVDIFLESRLLWRVWVMRQASQ